MNINNLNIKFSGEIHNPQLLYSKQVTAKQDVILRNRLALIVSELSTELPSIDSKDIQQVNLSLRSDGEIEVVVKLQDREVTLEGTKFSPKVKKQVEQLIHVIKQLKIFTAKEVSPLKAYPHISTHFQFTPHEKKESSSLLGRIHQFFQRFFSYHTTVRPLIQTTMQAELKGKSLEEIKRLYIENEQGFKNVKEQLMTQNPSLSQWFTSQELDHIIHEQFIQTANDFLNKMDKPLLDSSELYQLDVLRLLHDLKLHPSSVQVLQSLNKIDPLKLPVKVLAEVAITPANSDVLVPIWKNLLGNFFSKGQLDQIKEKKQTKDMILQTVYATHYLEALHFMPNETRRDLAGFMQELDQRQTSSAIQNFLIQRSTFLNLPLITEDPQIQHEQEIYTQHIHPALTEFIKRKIFKSLDASSIFKYLGMQKTAFDEINDLSDAIMQKLPTKEQRLFNREKIQTLFFNEVERVAVLDYHLLSSQLDNLRQVRQEFTDSRQQVEKIQDAIEAYKEGQTTIVKHFQTLLGDKQKGAVDPYLKIPTLELPIALASPEDREEAIQSYLNNLKGTENRLRKEIKTLEKEIKHLKKKPAKGQKAIQQREEIATKEQQVKAFDQELEQIEKVQEAQKKGDKQKLDELLQGMTHITVGARTIEAKDLASVHLQALEEAYKKLQGDLQVLEEKISQKHKNETKKEREEIKPALEEKIQGLKQLFEKLSILKKQQEEMTELEKQIQQASGELKQTFLATYNSLLKQRATAQPLLHPTIHQAHGELNQLLWTHLFEHLLNEAQLTKLNVTGPLDDKVKDQLAPYIKARAAFENLKAPEEFKKPLIQTYQALENQLTNPQVKEYLDGAIASYTTPSLSELTFNERVLKSIRPEDTSVFTPKQQTNLMILTRVLAQLDEGVKTLTTEDKENLKNALKEIEKDKNLQSKLDIFAEDDREDVDKFLSYIPSFLRGLVKHFVHGESKRSDLKIPGGITAASLTFVEDYLGNIQRLTKYEKQLHSLHQQVDQLIEKYQANPTSIVEEERVTLQQLGVLSRFARLDEVDEKGHSFIENLRKVGLLEVDSDLQKLANLSQEAKSSLDKLDKIIRPAIDQHYQDGSLLAYVGKKKSEWLGKPISFEEQLTMFAADGFTHGAKLYHKDGHLQIGHIYGNLEQDLLSLYQLCISDIWEIDIAPLIPSTMEPVLKDLYGDEWQKIINQRYQAIETSLHIKGETHFEQIVNNQERRLAAGFADHPLLFKLLGKKDIKGHERDYPKDFDKLHQKFFEGSPPNEDQICSEFASKATLVSMIQLNKELTQALQEKLGKNLDGENILNDLQTRGIEVPENVQEYLQGTRHYRERAKETALAQKQLIKLLKQNDYEAQTIDLIIRLGNKEIFDLPYSKTERLKAIHPGRMVQLLTDKKCAKLKSPPEAVKRLIAVA